MDRSRARSPISLQQLVGAAERLGRKDGNVPREQWLALVDEVRDRLALTPFEPLPLDAFTTTSGGKERLIVVSRPADRLLEEALLPLVHRRIEPHLGPGVHGYRPGRSTLTAAVAASQALARGHRHLAFLDVAAFYPSIDRGLLAERLRTAFPEGIAQLIEALVAAPILHHGKLDRPARGIPLGRALSPPLSNLFLTGVDAALHREDFVYLRYADDLLLLAQTPETLEAAVQLLTTELGRLGLMLNAAKTRRQEFDGAPLVYLGHTLDDRSVFERVPAHRLARAESIVSGARPAPRPPRGGALAEPDGSESESDVLTPSLRSRTLYLTESGVYLRMHQGLVIVQRGDETLAEVPLHRLDRVLVLAGAGMSSGFLSACIEARVSVLFYVGKGRAYGSLVADGMPNPLRLRAQYDLIGDAARRLCLGRAVVTAKLLAMQRRLVNAGASLREQRERIGALLERLDGAKDAEELRGFEGAATKAYYEGFASRIRHPELKFERRSKRPPRDAINSLLSFAYSLVFSEMQTALLAHGLDPYPGVLHDLRRGHPALASDLAEPYRALVADSFVLTLVNSRRIDPAGFELHAHGAVYMTAETRRLVIRAYEDFVTRPAGGARGAVTPRALIEAGARAMLHVVLGESEELLLPPSPAFLERLQLEPGRPPAAGSSTDGEGDDDEQ